MVKPFAIKENVVLKVRIYGCKNFQEVERMVANAVQDFIDGPVVYEVWYEVKKFVDGFYHGEADVTIRSTDQ